MTCTRSTCPPGHGGCWSLRLDRFVVCRADHEAPRGPLSYSAYFNDGPGSGLSYGAYFNDGPGSGLSYGAYFKGSRPTPPKPAPVRRGQPWADHVWLAQAPAPAQLARIRQARATYPASWMLTAREVLGC